jgi:agmatine deiminase
MPTEPTSKRRFPAEWERHEGTWFSWPQNRETWPTGLPETERALAEAVRALAGGEQVWLNCLDDDHVRHVRNIVGTDTNISFPVIPTNDAWCRDHGATFVFEGTERIALDWHYNAWGGKYPPFDLDQKVAGRMATMTGARHVTVDVTLEGGALETDGCGTLLTTASCVLNQNRNPGLDLHGAESLLKEQLGVDRIVWLEGELVGDDTDGHIDNLVRFTDRKTIVYPVVPEGDVHFTGFTRNRELLEANFHDDIRLIALPHPDPVWHEGVRLPASYMNFYVGNTVVVVPVYGCPADEEVCASLDALFPDRTVVPIRCTEVIRGLGALHCLSQQVPSKNLSTT